MQTDDGRKEARVVVDSEEEPTRVLLETRIHKEDGFQKQQGTSRPEVSEDTLLRTRQLTNPTETLIVWTEPQTMIDMALSFQEADGCAHIWFVSCFYCASAVVEPIHVRLSNC